MDQYFGISPKIAKWKEPSDFEEELAHMAGQNPRAKTIYSLYYKHLDPIYWTKGKEYARTLFQAQNNASGDFDQIYDDMVYCLHRYGLSFQDYLIYNLINKSEKNRSEFVADKLRYHYRDILNSPEIYELMTNKYACYSYYKQFFKREMSLLTKLEDIPSAVQFVKKHRRVIFKPLAEHSGHGIRMISISEKSLKDTLTELVSSTPGILEELIIQGEEMNIMNPQSVNSCRILTFTIGDDVTIIGATLRMGVGQAITDNAGAGGIYASIDVESGIIKTDAKNYNNRHYLFHPSTGTPILGFKMPEWDKAKELIKGMALAHRGTTLISWDIAYSNRGWCMVEANDNGDWSIIQSNSEIGLKNELYKLMDKYFDEKRMTKDDLFLLKNDD